MNSSITGGTRVWRARAKPFMTPELTTSAVLLFPSLLLLAVVIAYPIAQGFLYTFTDSSLLRHGGFVGMGNYGRLLQDRSFWHSLSFSAIFALSNVVGCYFLGLGLALMLQRDF